MPLVSPIRAPWFRYRPSYSPYADPHPQKGLREVRKANKLCKAQRNVRDVRCHCCLAKKQQAHWLLLLLLF